MNVKVGIRKGALRAKETNRKQKDKHKAHRYMLRGIDYA